MSNAVATVTYTQGQVWAKSPDGSLRPLQAGSLVNADEVIVTAEGASVELDFGDGIPVAIAGNQEVAMGRDLWDELAAGADEAAVEDESVRQALAILEQGGDLLEEMEDTAAGLAGGAGGGGISFVQLARLAIDTPELHRFEFTDTLPLPTAPAQQEARSINYPPVTADLNVQGDEDTAIIGRILATDADGDALTYQITTHPTYGSVVLDTTIGQFVYLPAANYHGADNFVVTVTDARGNSTTSTINVTVVPVNDLPVTADVNLSTDEDAAVAGQVLATDVDGDTLGYTLGTAPANGSVTLDPVTGDFVYTPAANFNGADSFVVVISDGQGGSVTSRVAVNVAPVNDAPVASDLALTTDEDVAVTGQISATDVDDDTLSFTTTTAPQNGVLVLNPSTGEFTYTPNSHHNGSDSFIVTISDGNGGTTTSTVTIGVTPVNDAPVVAPVTLADINEDGSIVITQTDLLAGTSDLDGDALTAINLSLTTGSGRLIDNGDGTWTFTPATDWNGDVGFAFEVSDGTVNISNAASLTVVSENDAPVASDLALTTDEDVAVTGQISATDVDGDTLNFTTTTAPQNGVVVLNPSTGEFTYTPDSHHNGSDSFIVTISDGNGGTTTSTVTIGVMPVNDAPVVAPVTLADINEDGSIVITQADLLAGASDLDGDALTAINLSLTTGNGSLIDNGDGTWTFTPIADWNGDVSFAFEVSDGTVNIPNTASLKVVSENDAPVASDLALTTDEDVAVTGQISPTDVDGDTLSYTVTTSPQNGVLILNPSTGEFTYTPDAHYNGSDSFIVTISDGNGGTTTSTVTIGVTSVNDAPVVTPVTLADINEDGSIVITQTDLLAGASDLDGDALTAINLSLTTGSGSLIDNGDGTWTFTPAADWNGEVSFAFGVSDGTVNIPNTASLTVVSENDAPVASDLALTTDEDVAVTGQISATDIDSDNLSYTVTTAAANGTVNIDPDTGTFTYTPNANYNGSDSFIVTVTDGNGGSVTSAITVDVLPVADTPILSANAIQISGDNVLPVPASVGLMQRFYDNVANVDASTATNPELVEVAVEAAVPTSENIVSDVYLPTVGVDDAYQYTGYVYLEAGHSYQLTGSRDDTLLVKIGGNIVYNAGFDQWGPINDEVREGNWSGAALEFPVAVSGYYSFEVVAYNGNEAGNLNLGLSVDGNAPVALSTENFYLYPDVSYLSESITTDSYVPNGDGGYYPAETNQYTYFLMNISASVGAPGETMNVTISTVPDGVVLTDGVNVFTATSGLDSVDVTGWGIDNIQVIPPTDYTGNFSLTVIATATDNTDSASATSILNFEVLSNDFNNIVGTPTDNVITGSGDADAIYALNGNDTLIGGAGNDYLLGGLGADTFAWSLGDAGTPGAPAVDKIGDVNFAQGDVLSLADLLQGEESNPLTNYLHFENDGSNTRIHVSSTGGYADAGYDAGVTDQIIVLEGVSLSGTNAEIIAQLQNANNLLVD
ncbi:retention module-containing protein [Cellvibrio sp. ARAG 10.3]|uniref:retention module-containing protein n=1 Tax=Cellvibrio sp. ARAG 10.3 TaxID=3451358 RepID=UPI003F45B36D